MYRAAFRLPKRVLLAGSVAGVSIHDKEKLSIYPPPNADILLVEAPSPLEQQIGVARRHVVRTFSDAHAHVQGWVSKWIGVEHAVEHRVKSIMSPQESLTPGILYVGVATLSGSIIARNRFLVTRLLLPPIFLVTSAKYFLPKTTGNLSTYLGSLEETHFPVLAEKHDIAKAHSRMAWERLKDSTANGREQINKSAVVVVEKVQELTGLKLRETLGWTQDTVKTLETKVEKVTESVNSKVAEVEAVIDKKVEEVKVGAETKVEEVKKLV